MTTIQPITSNIQYSENSSHKAHIDSIINSSNDGSINTANINHITLSSTPIPSWDLPSLSTSSRRSSSASLSTLVATPSSQTSFNYSQQHPMQKQQQKTAIAVSIAIDELYPTQQAAHERIEHLEEYLKRNKAVNAQIVEAMSESIQRFLAEKTKRDNAIVSNFTVSLEEMPRSAGTIAQEKTAQFKARHHGDAEIYDPCVQTSVTVHNDAKKQPRPENVSVDQGKYQRLIRAIHALNKKKNQQIRNLQAELTSQKRERRKEKMELEQLLSEMTQEMTSMMEELNQLKQQCLEYEEEKAAKRQPAEENQGYSNTRLSNTRLPTSRDSYSLQHPHPFNNVRQQNNNKQMYTDKDLQEIKAHINLIHTQEVNALVLEKEELRKRLIQSEQRFSEQQQQQHLSTAKHDIAVDSKSSSQLELALQRAVAERDGEIAKLKQDMSKLKRTSEQQLQDHETRLQREIGVRVADFESRLKLQYQKEMDTYQVQLSREIRNLSGRIVELEAELAIDEEKGGEQQQQQQKEEAASVKGSETKRISFQQPQQHPFCPEKSSNELLLERKVIECANKEDELLRKLDLAEQKVRLLEQETFMLYSKNLKMVKRLGELE